jgi:transcriptional regulator with XRE-family HTH domain
MTRRSRRRRVEELRRLRVEKGYSQRQLADRAAIDQAAISQIEGGKRNPSVAVLERLAAAMDVGVAELFPKVQASLFEEASPAEQRRSPFVEAWTSYMLRLAQEWEEALPNSDELRVNPQLAFEVLRKDELVQSESSMLLQILREAIDEVFVGVPPERAKRATLKELIADLARPDEREFFEASLRMDDVAGEWSARSKIARGTAADAPLELRDQRERARESSEKAERSAEGRRKALAPFGELRSRSA